MFDLLMFDLDGTLVHTAPEIADAANDVLRSLDLRTATDAQVNGWIGDGARELMVRAIADAGGEDESAIRDDTPRMNDVMQQFAQAYDVRCGQRSQLYPSVIETLRDLQHRGIPLALVTNKESRLTERVLDVHGLRRFFDTVVAGDTLARSKPDPMQLHHCLDIHHVTADKALLVGDSRVDVAAARAAGVICWAVPYGYNRGRPISEAHPDRLIDNISVVLEAVSGNASEHLDGQSRATVRH